MKGPLPQPAGKFRQSSPSHRELRCAAAADLITLIRDLRGDPRLTAWEEGFFSNVEHLLRRTGDCARLTEKQWNRIWIIQDRVARQPDDDDFEETDAEPVSERWDGEH